MGRLEGVFRKEDTEKFGCPGKIIKNGQRLKSAQSKGETQEECRRYGGSKKGN